MRKLFGISFVSLCLVLSAATVRAGDEKTTTVTTCTVSGRTSSGRDIKGSADVPLGIKVQDEIAEVTFDNHTLRIEQKRLLLDGKKCGKVPAEASSIELTCAKHKLSVTADSKEVLTMEIGK